VFDFRPGNMVANSSRSVVPAAVAGMAGVAVSGSLSPTATNTFATLPRSQQLWFGHLPNLDS
jgi:hypothetical protein